MIDIVALTANDIGRWVWYQPAVGDWEKGRIKSWNSEFVFVVYKCNGEWKRFKDFTGAATDPKDIEFIRHQSHCKAKEGFVCACLPLNQKQFDDNFIESPASPRSGGGKEDKDGL